MPQDIQNRALNKLILLIMLLASTAQAGGRRGGAAGSGRQPDRPGRRVPRDELDHRPLAHR